MELIINILMWELVLIVALGIVFGTIYTVKKLGLLERGNYGEPAYGNTLISDMEGEKIYDAGFINDNESFDNRILEMKKELANAKRSYEPNDNAPAVEIVREEA